MPPREVELGILERDLLQRPLLQRLGHGFSQGAHPYLWRHRLLGDETLRVNAMSADGRDSVVRLQPYHPRVHITQPARPEAEAPVVLDCVFWETDEKRVTLVWRGSLPAAHPGTVAGWEERCSYRVGW